MIFVRDLTKSGTPRSPGVGLHRCKRPFVVSCVDGVL